AIASFQIFNMVQSMSATNLHKTAWYQWADVRSEARVDTDYFALPLPYGVGQREDGKFGVLTYKWKTPIKQSDVNRQIYAYMPVNMLRLIDLLIASLYVTEASQDWTVPFLSMAALWLLVPASYWANHYMAAKQYPDAAKVIGTQKAWDEIRKRFLPDWFLQKIEAASPSAAATIRGDFAQRELGKFPSLGEKALRLLGLGRDTGRSKCESLVGLIPDDLQ